MRQASVKTVSSIHEPVDLKASDCRMAWVVPGWANQPWPPRPYLEPRPRRPIGSHAAKGASKPASANGVTVKIRCAVWDECVPTDLVRLITRPR